MKIAICSYSALLQLNHTIRLVSTSRERAVLRRIVGGASFAIVFFTVVAHCGGQTFRDCDICPELVVVPVGSFTMGSPENEGDRSSDEGPQGTVTFVRPFAMGKYEVRYSEFLSFVKATGRAMEPCFHEPGFPQTDPHPAACVTWKDAKAYVAWLSSITGNTYRAAHRGRMGICSTCGHAARQISKLFIRTLN